MLGFDVGTAAHGDGGSRQLDEAVGSDDCRIGMWMIERPRWFRADMWIEVQGTPGVQRTTT